MTSRLTSVVAKSAVEIQELRSIWQRWQDHPDNDIDNFLLLLKARKEISRAHVMLISRGDQPVTLVTGRLEQSHMNFTLGYKKVRGPKLNSLIIPYGGILGQLDDEIAPLIVTTLSREFRTDNVDRIAFYFLPEDSSVMHALQKVKGKQFRISRGDWSPHFMANLCSDVDTFWARLSRQHRNFLRRKARNLERDHNCQIEYSCVTEEASLQSLCEQIEEVAKKTYLRGLGKGFIWDAEHFERLTVSARNRRLRAFLLRISGKTVSYVVGPVYNGKFNLAYTAYDPAFSHYDVGQLILVHAIESLCREGLKYFDFGFGAARYKEQFGDKCVRERSVSLYAPTVKATTIAATQRIAAGGSNAARICLERIGVLKFLKRQWRKGLARGQNGHPAAQTNGPDTHS